MENLQIKSKKLYFHIILILNLPILINKKKRYFFYLIIFHRGDPNIV